MYHACVYLGVPVGNFTGDLGKKLTGATSATYMPVHHLQVLVVQQKQVSTNFPTYELCLPVATRIDLFRIKVCTGVAAQVNKELR